VYNHLVFTVEVHESDDQLRIVGFEVEPLSIDWGDSPCSYNPSAMVSGSVSGGGAKAIYDEEI
jgi:hypothetical protein